MAEWGTLLCVIIVGLRAYRQAVAAGTWSWPAFGWTMLAMLVWVAAIVVSGTWVPRIVGWDHKMLILAGILVPLLVGAVPVLMIANRLNPGRRREPGLNPPVADGPQQQPAVREGGEWEPPPIRIGHRISRGAKMKFHRQQPW